MSSSTAPETGSSTELSLEISDTFREEVARDMEFSNSLPLPAGGTPPKAIFPPLPAFLIEGGGAHEVATSGTTIEAGSLREFVCRSTGVICGLSLLCLLLGISSSAAPWYAGTLGGQCIVGFGLSAYGRLSGCEGIIGSYPSAFPNTFNSAAVATLGFAQFLMVAAIFCMAASTGVAGVMCFRLVKGYPPHRFGTAFLLTALTASSFACGALAMIIGTARYLQYFRDSDQPFTPTIQGGHGAGDTLVVFMCGVMVAAIVVKIKVRAAAVLSEGSPERVDLEALLGAKPEGHFCL